MRLDDQHFMQRAFDLAALGSGKTSPNPIVGAVLVYEGRIIGEGYHRAYGQAHAEVNAVANVKPHDRKYIPRATFYVSLEPCNIHRNTPPCTLLILQERIPRVVISYLDYTPGVNGSGIERLQQEGVDVTVGVLREKGQQLSRVRNTFVQQNRPYVILKWAQSADGFFAPETQKQRWLTNAFSKRWVHKWRGEVDGVLVGYNTAATDNPQLNNRLYYGGQPKRIVLDRDGSLPKSLHVFDGRTPTIVLTAREGSSTGNLPNVSTVQALDREDWAAYTLKVLAGENISSIIIEGGKKTLQAFIEKGLWDEARVFVASKYIEQGRRAPSLQESPIQSYEVGSDRLLWYRNSLNLH